MQWILELDRGVPFAEAVPAHIARHPHYEAEIRAFDERWHEINRGVIADSVAILQSLQRQRVPNYAITNFSAEKFDEARAIFPFLDSFDGIVVSGREWLLKPDAGDLSPAARSLWACRRGLPVHRRRIEERGRREGGRHARPSLHQPGRAGEHSEITRIFRLIADQVYRNIIDGTFRGHFWPLLRISGLIVYILHSSARRLPMTAAFPMNAWYAAAWDVDIKHELFPRTVCGKHVVMYRKADGRIAALEDACWHRLVPLSKGRLQGDTVVCGYHGLKYDPQGRCTFMPSQETINPSACVRAYPAVERHRYVWLWMGDPALADPALVPDLHWNDDPAWAGDGKTIHVKCDYRLVLDNLMDLTHETFVHGSSIGNDAVAEAPFDVTHGNRTATVTRWMKGIDAPPFWAAQLGKPGPGRSLADHPLRGAGDDRDRRRRRTCRHRRAGGRPLAGRQRLRAQHHHAGDGDHLSLLLGVRAQLSHHRAAADHRDPRRRIAHLPRGRTDPRGATARDGRKPRPRVLQPQHRCRRDVDAQADRPDGGRGSQRIFLRRRRSDAPWPNAIRTARSRRPCGSSWRCAISS